MQRRNVGDSKKKIRDEGTEKEKNGSPHFRSFVSHLVVNDAFFLFSHQDKVQNFCSDIYITFFPLSIKMVTSHILV